MGFIVLLYFFALIFPFRNLLLIFTNIFFERSNQADILLGLTSFSRTSACLRRQDCYSSIGKIIVRRPDQNSIIDKFQANPAADMEMFQIIARDGKAPSRIQNGQLFKSMQMILGWTIQWQVLIRTDSVASFPSLTATTRSTCWAIPGS